MANSFKQKFFFFKQKLLFICSTGQTDLNISNHLKLEANAEFNHDLNKDATHTRCMSSLKTCFFYLLYKLYDLKRHETLKHMFEL